jgi:hypothetical protein
VVFPAVVSLRVGPDSVAPDVGLASGADPVSGEEATLPVPDASRVPAALPELRFSSHQTIAMINTMTMTQMIHSIAKPFCR